MKSLFLSLTILCGYHFAFAQPEMSETVVLVKKANEVLAKLSDGPILSPTKKSSISLFSNTNPEPSIQTQDSKFE